MIPPYTLIVPYYRTPEITRLALHSIFHFSMGEPEVLVVDNAPGSPESKMLDEFPRIRRLDNATEHKGSYGNFHALDVGLAAASHDLVGLVHSDTIFLERGWDKRWFGRLVNADLAALSTFEREANPFRPWRKRVGDWLRHLRHNPRPGQEVEGKLMYHFLLTRRSVLADIEFNFLRDWHLAPRHFAGRRNGVELLSLWRMSRVLWHTSNISSLLTGQMDDPKLVKSFQEKRARFLRDPFVQEHFRPVLPAEFQSPA
ncbi:MAG: hypothetical protein FD161_3423 [Limisphaerales bacterium]|nr:MAG: hypothetical protein FD161_3423 [Limisphaerales bacterium]KAG0507744.1 MAG: hypothetical protein E1N63_3089 [Limisphaerales bacterium]TXT51091.1 MAG: hypothetical protein FD140_1937 [Limisphaerales bacterium]